MATSDRFESAVQAIDPNASLISFDVLKGGISASMWVLRTSRANYVARRPGIWRTSENAEAARTEFETLGRIHTAGLPVPAPLFLEESLTVPPDDRFFVMEFVDATAELKPSDIDGFLTRYAELLYSIHKIDLQATGLENLRRLKNPWTPKGATNDDRLNEEEVRRALESRGPMNSGNAEVLRHADLWPGNVLWKDGEVAAVVDWENVCVGDPLADLSICRLDLLWILGWEAMEDFTRHYLDRADLDSTLLPYFDLVASLRPANYTTAFASAYPDFGRPDITPATLVRDHNKFVESALDRFSRMR